MKATVYFTRLTDEQIETINDAGWDCEVGQQFMAARKGIKTDRNAHLFEKVAVLDATDAEDVWIRMQNTDMVWRQDRTIINLTDCPRSMDVGDRIHWDDGRIEVCKPCGFDLDEGEVGPIDDAR